MWRGSGSAAVLSNLEGEVYEGDYDPDATDEITNVAQSIVDGCLRRGTVARIKSLERCGDPSLGRGVPEGSLGLDWYVRASTPDLRGGLAGRFRIEDSSVIVPLSDSTSFAFNWSCK